MIFAHDMLFVNWLRGLSIPQCPDNRSLVDQMPKLDNIELKNYPHGMIFTAVNEMLYHTTVI